MKRYASNRATEEELRSLHRELHTAMTELIANRNAARAAQILRHLDRRLVTLRNSMTLISEPETREAMRAAEAPMKLPLRVPAAE
jgi:hypothetical protein